MTAFRKISALVALSLMVAAGPAAAYGVSPSAPDSEQDASTVQLQEVGHTNGGNAPRIGISPTATASEQNATTVQLTDVTRGQTGNPAPRIGVSPSAPDQVFDATTVNVRAVN